MLKTDGEQRLRDFTAIAYPPTVTEIVPGTIFHVMGYGHSNASFIIGNESVILIDTLDTDARGEKLAHIIANKTDKPVKTIIYTHGHPDHRGGAGAFASTDPEIIAFAPSRPPLSGTEMISGILDHRGTRQFGYDLTDDEAISQGIGIREGFTVGDGVRRPLPPTTVYEEDLVHLDIDGVTLSLVAAPGECEDEIFVWSEEHSVLFCADNYFGCWPNLYAIRGGQYRDVAGWIASLDRMREYPAEALLPGHTHPVLGRENVRETLDTFRNALDFVLTETLACMNAGLGIEETVERVTLPEPFATSPLLQEFYGTVAWSVRSIYTAYLGWFDGNPTHLNPLPPKKRATKMVEQMGGRDAVLTAATGAIESGDAQWALELADLLMTLDPDDREARDAKARGLRDLARQETSANGRHYYLASANELRNESS
ncbi:MAG TPA: alkyl/aryl-sulfatase [Thermomicrobiales bacterium]|nr:alkyl/aryl-sulfatase [Thermomicrobiales bacterium]